MYARLSPACHQCRCSVKHRRMQHSAVPFRYKLFLAYGKIFRLSFGPKSFVVISDAGLAKQVLLTNAPKYSKGLLSEILNFVMGQGLIPADGEIWRTRRRAIVPSLHRRYSAFNYRMADHGIALTRCILKPKPHP